MAIRSAIACNHPGCGALNCQQHTEQARRQQFDSDRSREAERSIYKTAQWQRTRAFILARDPLCRIAIVCLRKFGRAMPSTEAEHIIPVRDGGAIYDPSNLQGACKPCHSRKTALEDSSFARRG